MKEYYLGMAIKAMRKAKELQEQKADCNIIRFWKNAGIGFYEKADKCY